jgi:hypothetical protein
LLALCVNENKLNSLDVKIVSANLIHCFLL